MLPLKVEGMIRSMLLTLFYICMILPSAKAVYDEDLSKTLLRLSAAAYGTKDNRQQCLDNTLPANEDWKIVSNMDVEADSLNNQCSGFIAASHKRKTVIVAFRGTKKPGQLFLEALKSLRMGGDYHEMGGVHSYFRKAIEILWKPISKIFARHNIENIPDKPELFKNDYTIIFTGHSLGGALAALAAARILKYKIRDPSKVKLYTFGQPRTGSLLFSWHMDSYVHVGFESYRVVFRNDSVPHFPPCQENKHAPPNKYGVRSCFHVGKEDQFYHHGMEIWYPDSMTPGSNYKICDGGPMNEDKNCSNQFKYTIDENFEKRNWDHRHYFDVSLVNFGKSGCTNRTHKAIPREFRHRIEVFASFISGMCGGKRKKFFKKINDYL